MRDDEIVTYMNILLDSLKKKEELLLNLKTETLKQAGILEKMTSMLMHSTLL
ncbi:MAG: hypothetical protein J6Z28_08955 [Succinivibrio sp.]|nr:hypothetical protein [Succinivibrio sp.]